MPFYLKGHEPLPSDINIAAVHASPCGDVLEVTDAGKIHGAWWAPSHIVAAGRRRIEVKRLRIDQPVPPGLANSYTRGATVGGTLFVPLEGRGNAKHLLANSIASEV